MDNKTVISPTFLDGEITPGGQGQEGNRTLADLEHFSHIEYVQGLRDNYKFYVCLPGQILSNEDYETLWNDQSQKYLSLLTPMQRSLHNDRITEITGKIDLDATHLAMQKAIYNQRLSVKKHASHQLGAREFTFTYSPKWCGDEEARDLMKKAISKLIKYYSDEVIQLRAVGEVGTNGLSHVHCFYKLRGGLKISDKNFKRAYKYWNPKKVTSKTGHEGGHHANVRVESDFQGYIDKDVDTAWLDIYYPEVDPTA